MFNFKKGFSLVEVLIYLGLFVLIIGLTYPIFTNVISNYLVLSKKVDLKTEVRNIFLKIQREVLKSNSLDILTDWEMAFNQKNETIVIFQTEPVYLDTARQTVKGWATNLSVGRISFSGSNYNVSSTPSSTCTFSSGNSTSSHYAFSGYAWSPNIGWIKFRNDPGETIIYGVCEDSNKELRGWAWNDVIGWLSFNCADLGICTTSNYKVVEKDNYLYGYAWNDTVGWIIFDGNRGSVYLAKMNPSVYYLERVSDPRVFVEELKFTKLGKSYRVNVKIKSESVYETGETAIVLPFK